MTPLGESLQARRSEGNADRGFRRISADCSRWKHVGVALQAFATNRDDDAKREATGCPVRLATDIYRPTGMGGALPTILIRLPYNKANLNTGGHNYDETTSRIAKNSIHHSAAHLSRLVLPVVTR